jgi:hypothetical protein
VTDPAFDPPSFSLVIGAFVALFNPQAIERYL